MLLSTLALAAFAAPTTIAPSGETGEIEWIQGTHMGAVGRARQEGKLLFTYFWADGSGQCVKLYKETMGDERVKKELGDVLCYSADVGQPAGRKLLERYGIETLPAMLITSSAGEPEEMLLGFMTPDTFVGEMQRVKRGENTISDLRKRILQLKEGIEELERNLEMRQMLSEKLGYVGNEEESKKVRLSILSADPKCETLVGARAHTSEITHAMMHAGGDEVASWDMKPLKKHLKKMKNVQGRMEGYISLGNWQMEAEAQKDARRSYMTAWSNVPEDKGARINSGAGLVDKYWHMRKDLAKKDAKFILAVASEVVDLGEEHWGTPKDGDGDGGDGGDGDAYGDGDGDGGDGDGWRDQLAERKARGLFLNGKRKEAIALMKQCVENQPENEDYVAYLETFEQGA